MKPRKYGWKPDLWDQRDKLYKAVAPTIALPEKVDLSPWCTAVEDQGPIGSCTANALSGNIEFLNNMDKVFTPEENVSRLFVYYNERAIEGSIPYDSGAAIRDGIKTLNRQGWCDETLWPYIPNKFAVRPPFCCYIKATKNAIKEYTRLETLNDMLTCLASGFPFVFGFTVYESFEGPQVAATGIVNMPQINERAVGGHAVLAVGYDQSIQRFLIRNSWGSNWGINGNFTMPFQYLEELADDFWTIRK